MRVLRQNLRSFALWGFSQKLMEKNHLIKKIKELAYFSNKIRIVSQKKIVGTLRVKIHLWIHTGEMSWKCSQCDKDFHIRASLRYICDFTLGKGHNNAANVIRMSIYELA